MMTGNHILGLEGSVQTLSKDLNCVTQMYTVSSNSIRSNFLDHAFRSTQRKLFEFELLT